MVLLRLRPAVESDTLENVDNGESFFELAGMKKFTLDDLFH